MTKREFLDGLRSALGNDLGGPVIQENVSYYDSYIDDEIRKGRSEEEVTEELGDPWVIAQTIIDSVQGERGGDRQESYGDYAYEPQRGNYGGEQSRGRSYMFSIDTWWKKLLLALAVVGIIFVVFTIVGGILSLILPLIVPVLLIVLVIRLLNRR